MRRENRKRLGVADALLHRTIQIVYRPITELKFDPKNPRIHSKKQIGQIARSIETFGFNVPVLIDKDGNIIAGHGRVLACKELGIADVPTICLEHLTQSQARAFLIADNKLTENATWDNRLLGEQLKALLEVDLDFSLEVTGFEMGEIDFHIENLDSASQGRDDPTDDLSEITEPAVAKPGDIWALGRHRLYCGDAREEVSYQKLMGNKKAGMVFIDPPYNVPIDGHATGLGKIHHNDFAMASGEMNETEFITFLTLGCQLLTRFSHDGALHFICMDWRHMRELLEACRRVYSEFKNLCVWAKDNGGMGSLYRSQHELIFVFKHGKGAHRNNVQLGQHGRNRSNVWRYPGANSFARGTDEGNLLALHPTVKPVALVADALLDCSKRREVVLDAFLGSGTTLIAAERVGRTCYGMEIDPRYIDTAIRRWQKFTGQHALLEGNGTLFDQIAGNVGESHEKEI